GVKSRRQRASSVSIETSCAAGWTRTAWIPKCTEGTKSPVRPDGARPDRVRPDGVRPDSGGRVVPSVPGCDGVLARYFGHLAPDRFGTRLEGERGPWLASRFLLVAFATTVPPGSRVPRSASWRR